MLHSFPRADIRQDLQLASLRNLNYLAEKSGAGWGLHARLSSIILAPIMGKSRLEAFSDGVIAILITIMVLELRTPQGTDWAALRVLAPAFFSYVLSFIFLGIYWNNHHHLLHAASAVNGKILWANLHLLFWLSLIPFVTGWMGEHSFARMPVALYGVVLSMAAVAYTILVRALIVRHGKDSVLARAIGNDFKGRISLVLCVAAVGFSFISTGISMALYVIVAIIWLIPDPRIERALEAGNKGQGLGES